MSARRGRVQIVLPDRPGKFTLEQAVEGFFLGVADLLGQALDSNASTLVVRDLQVLLSGYLASFLVRQQVPDLLIVNFRVTDSDCDGLVELVAR